MKEISSLKKIITCIIAGMVSGFCFRRIASRFMIDWLSFGTIVVISIIILLSAIAYGVWWGLQKHEPSSHAKAVLAVWQGITRYGIALDLSMIGFQKLFRLQFSTPLAKLDQPFSSFSPEDLSWAFYGQSRALVCIIGGLQILGSLLLLFNRTRLAGVFVLLPVMVNIVLLNYCYHFGWGESLQASELLLALVYLLFCEYDRLKAFFFRSANEQPSIALSSGLLRNMLRLPVILIPLLLIWHYGASNKDRWLTGKYKVNRLWIDQRDTAANSCSDSLPTMVYFDQGNDCVFRYNGPDRLLLGNYRWDADRQMTVIWRYPRHVRDTLHARIAIGGSHGLTIAGKMGRDSIRMELEKMN